MGIEIRVRTLPCGSTTHDIYVSGVLYVSAVGSAILPELLRRIERAVAGTDYAG